MGTQEPPWTETLAWAISVRPEAESGLGRTPQPRSAIATTYPEQHLVNGGVSPRPVAHVGMGGALHAGSPAAMRGSTHGPH